MLRWALACSLTDICFIIIYHRLTNDLPEIFSNYIENVDNPYNSRSCANNAAIPQVRLDATYGSIKIAAAYMWNLLPIEITKINCSNMYSNPRWNPGYCLNMNLNLLFKWSWIWVVVFGGWSLLGLTRGLFWLVARLRRLGILALVRSGNWRLLALRVIVSFHHLNFTFSHFASSFSYPIYY